jgi:hypothetical protein
MKALLRICAVLLLAFGAWAAWGRFGYLVRSDPSANLQAESLAGPGLRAVSLERMTDFAWDQVVFFGPYARRDAVQRALGFDWPAYEDAWFPQTDLYNLVVFVEGRRVTRWWKLRRCAPDIDKSLVGVAVSRGEASFVLQNNETCSFLRGPAAT